MTTNPEPSERYKGVKEYERLFQEGKIKQGDEIQVFSHEGQIPFTYTVVSDAEVMSGNLSRRIRKVLQGKEWMIAPPSGSIDDAVAGDLPF